MRINEEVRLESLTYEPHEREFRPYYRNVEASPAAAVDAPRAPSHAGLGDDPHSGHALPHGLARAHPSLSLYPQSLSLCV